MCSDQVQLIEVFIIIIFYTFIVYNKKRMITIIHISSCNNIEQLSSHKGISYGGCLMLSPYM